MKLFEQFLFLPKQGLAFRGHTENDDSDNKGSERESSTTVGQCFDDASAIRGSYKGIASHLKQIVSTAIYIHCNGHVLNLCLVDVAQAVAPVRNNFGIVESLFNFIEGSAKRHKVFEDIQKQESCASTLLEQLCDTRCTCCFTYPMIQIQTITNTKHYSIVIEHNTVITTYRLSGKCTHIIRSAE
ncbi:unnamed protein product [Adineta steineri]|uniref:Uncharacterized protein n=1 Tax=Adineta steineri TaxID=433720 RepID=A0A818H8L0_9BILA|nr:unnamed protein product [Adineta steineri]CAF0730341.1 unnamed protein product [Adineta steineri]CAF3504000.1 unnamed protein product [Adineta steineri]CAF4157565.1 unnamed protein product [Adineta steineri]